MRFDLIFSWSEPTFFLLLHTILTIHLLPSPPFLSRSLHHKMEYDLKSYSSKPCQYSAHLLGGILTLYLHLQISLRFYDININIVLCSKHIFGKVINSPFDDCRWLLAFTGITSIYPD